MPRPLSPLASPSASGSIPLAPGQTLRIWLPSGSTVVSNGPALKISGTPRWIAGQWLQQTQIVDEGQSLQLEHGGWLQIDAARGGELLCLSPATARGSAPLAGLWQQLAGRIRSAYRRKNLSGVSKTG